MPWCFQIWQQIEPLWTLWRLLCHPCHNPNFQMTCIHRSLLLPLPSPNTQRVIGRRVQVLLMFSVQTRLVPICSRGHQLKKYQFIFSRLIAFLRVRQRVVTECNILRAVGLGEGCWVGGVLHSANLGGSVQCSYQTCMSRTPRWN